MYQSFASDLLLRSITDGTIDIGAYEYSTITGIIENQQLPDISIFPNPFHSSIELSLPNKNWKDVAISISDNSGHIIFRHNDLLLTNDYTNTIDLEHYPSGIYFVEITLDGKHFLKKIVKE